MSLLYAGAVNILQQITEFSSEAHNAVTSMVAMAPGTVAVVEQVSNNIMCFFSQEIMCGLNVKMLTLSCG